MSNILVTIMTRSWIWSMQKGGYIMATLIALVAAIIVFKVVLNALSK